MENIGLKKSHSKYALCIKKCIGEDTFLIIAPYAIANAPAKQYARLQPATLYYWP